MPLKDKIERAKETTLKIIDSSDLDEAAKMYYADLTVQAAEGTNGLTEKEKLQNVSETCFTLTNIIVQQNCKSHNEFGILSKKLDDLAQGQNTLTANQNGLAAKIEVLDSKLSSISDRLDQNDADTKTLMDKMNNVESRSTSDFVAEKDGEKSRLEIMLNGIRNLSWYWPAALVAIFAIIAYHPEILEFLKKIF